MTDLIPSIQTAAVEAIAELYGKDVPVDEIVLQETKKEFEGDFTLVVFPLMRYKLGGGPPQVGEALGQALQARLPFIEGYNVIKGFLNLSIRSDWWQQFLGHLQGRPDFYRLNLGQGQSVVVEYCSPNTNKPLHLGHLRNIILGYALSRILEASGYQVHETCLYNDRGTNISKSMYAWLQAGKQETPEMAGVKGDKLVGDYYVAFSRQYAAEVGELIAKGLTKAEAEKAAPSMQAVHEMTVRWEAGDEAVRDLWRKMNQWVYTAFADTFAKLGVKFERFYYESQVYQRGKETVAEGLEKGVFYQEEDGSVVVDLTDDGLDKKVLLRSNGTSLYITQDLAIAEDKFESYQMDRSIYVVGNEQDYHFKVLFKILEKLGKPYAEGLYHLSYGMVDLPSGKMKSREGTTVEADDLMAEMIEQAARETQKLGKTEGMDEAELQALYRTLGIGALKYYLVKVDPRKRMLFDPNESIDLHGQTAPFIQSSYTRTVSIGRKAEAAGMDLVYHPDQTLETPMLEVERSLLRMIFRYPQVLQEAANGYNPALLANYAYDLAKEYNRFYHEAPVLRREQPQTSAFRFALSTQVGQTLKEALALLGIEMPERM
ncbi:MAG: arginine--tRNA ligase [Bacteroidetes bacterium]|nr:MAG: arginine--tRNA ligase [Bacteroidota bacterium]